MTTLIAKAPVVAHFGLVRYVRDQIEAIKAAAATRMKYTEVFGQLNAMTDRDLADIGVNRGMIHEIAFAAAAK